MIETVEAYIGERGEDGSSTARAASRPNRRSADGADEPAAGLAGPTWGRETPDSP